MLQSVRTYVYDRRKALGKTAGVVGGLYLVGRYVSDRLEEVKENVMQERAARENLRRRFQQNRDDISFTIMALIPTLGDQILHEMDVESVTQELQSVSALSKRSLPPPPPSESSLASSIDLLQDRDARSDSESVALSVSSTFSGQDDGASYLGDSSRSWVQQLPPDTQLHSPSFTSEALASSEFLPEPGARLLGSLGADNIPRSDEIPREPSPVGLGMSESMLSSSVTSDSSITRTKAELWKEVKILTFTRTLTILYSTTLLSLFTTIQLTILARSKYVSSIVQLERDERMREQMESQFNAMSLLLGGENALNDLMLGLSNEDDVENGLSEDIESKYLTLNWWMLHVGWKDIGERVRRGVEEVFDGVSLKSKLSVLDLHRLVSDVRRRVEHEVTFEGRERRINFLSSLLPPTPEITTHVLTQGGIPHSQAHAHDETFKSLLDETRSIILSSDFERVLEVCLDRATSILFSGLEKNVWDVEGDGGQEIRLRLASLLPGLARWSHLALNGLPNELVDVLTETRELVGLSAIVFPRFGDKYS